MRSRFLSARPVSLSRARGPIFALRRRMIPISDENPTLNTPIMTWLLLGAMFAVWFTVQGGGVPGHELQLVTSICNLGMVPGEITHRAAVGLAVPLAPGLACVVDRDPINIYTPLISMFLHGGWAHILGNALFFWVFGSAIEDSMGPARFLVFYLLCGLIAAGTHIAMQPASPVPTVGASGAISGVLGAYLVLYPACAGAHVLLVSVVLSRLRDSRLDRAPLLVRRPGDHRASGMGTVRPDVSSGVAVWAHIGGFVAGMILIKLFQNPRLIAARSVLREPRGWAAIAR